MQAGAYKNKKSGFTYAEMLLVLVISSILAVAMVPLLGPKKVKDPRAMVIHGIYQCYYDDSGNLKAFTASEKDGWQAHSPETNDGSCTMPVPDAPYYAFHLIGAGGPGYGVSDAQIADLVENTKWVDESVTKYIDAFGNFSSEVASLPEYIKNWWNEHPVSMTYTVTSKPASKGEDYSYKYVDNTRSVCVSSCQTNEFGNYPNECQELNCLLTSTCAGGVPGNGAQLKVDLPINAESNISITNTNPVTLTVNEQSAKLSKADDGTNAQVGLFGNGCVPGDDGKNAAICEGALCDEKALRSVDSSYSGGVEASNGGRFIVEYPLMEFKFTYGNPGVQGKQVYLVYARLKSESLVLTPADGSDELQSKIFDNNKKLLLSTNDKLKNPLFGSQIVNYTNNKSDGFPVPNFVNDVVKPKSPVFKEINMRKDKFNDGLAAISVKPGEGGYGGYVFFEKLVPGKKATIEGSEPVEIETSSMQYKYDDMDKINCVDGNKPKKYKKDDPTDYYWVCSGTAGQKGAIVVTW